MAITLRPYQRDALAAIRQDWRSGFKRLIISSATGTGKTILVVFLIWAARQNGLRCLVIVNTDELIQQTVDKLQRVGVEPGIVKAGKNEWMRDVVVASIQTLSKSSRLYNLPPNHFGVVITDECHYANAASYQRVLWYFQDAWHLGVTATPFRGDKRSVAGAGWDKVSYVYTMQQAMKDGWLAPARFVQVNTGVAITGVTKSKATLTSDKDFNQKALARIINTPARNDKIAVAAIEHLIYRNGPLNNRMRRTIAFCADVDHAIELANAFRRRGVEAFAVYGSMKEKARRLVLLGHRMGRYPVLCNCNILTHGYDDPQVEAIIMARPTESKVLYIQEIGRGLRRSDETGKTDCIIMDVVDVMKKHTLTIGKELCELEDAIGDAEDSPEKHPSSQVRHIEPPKASDSMVPDRAEGMDDLIPADDQQAEQEPVDDDDE